MTSGASTVAVAAPFAAAAVALLALWVSGVRAERHRRREFYAEALEATFAYREFAYAVRRRRHDAPSEERVRISELLREVQRDISRYQALMSLEPPNRVSSAYEELVVKTREIAGGYIRKGWNHPPITRDREMSVPGGLDFSSIEPAEKDFLDAVREDLAWWRIWR